MKWKLGFDIGWFNGENFKLIKISFIDVVDNEFIQLIGIQIFKFIIEINIEK